MNIFYRIQLTLYSRYKILLNDLKKLPKKVEVPEVLKNANVIIIQGGAKSTFTIF